jgi:cold shock CspA family protein
MMRDQGRLVEWFDEKGYGFIQPNEPDKGRVFLHIKDFARPGPRPIIGCALEYLVILDAQGRYRAQQVTYLTAAQARKKPARQQTRSQSKKSFAALSASDRSLFYNVGYSDCEWSYKWTAFIIYYAHECSNLLVLCSG